MSFISLKRWRLARVWAIIVFISSEGRRHTLVLCIEEIKHLFDLDICLPPSSCFLRLSVFNQPTRQRSPTFLAPGMDS